ncbi:hypothetical protein H4Q26_016234 [Puccinia striiformis f. sp. tritici PST-130]|nr:hypothetical protein H4Q26_016234 [Puccinia striiformis f. sp. tritici PST-130]
MIIPTSGEVDHQEKPAGTDDYRALNELHSPKDKDEESLQEAKKLKTQADAQLFVQHYALQALAELKQDIPKFAKRSRRDEKYFIDRLAKIEDLIRQNTGVPRDPILDLTTKMD